MAVILLDSSAVIAYLYGDDALHRPAVRAVEPAVMNGGALAISAVTWSELLNGVFLGHGDERVVRGFVAEFAVAILPVDADVGERAAKLQAGYATTGRGRDMPRLRTPDALILATADVYDEIATVICGDGRWPKVPGVAARIDLLVA